MLKNIYMMSSWENSFAINSIFLSEGRLPLKFSYNIPSWLWDVWISNQKYFNNIKKIFPGNISEYHIDDIKKLLFRNIMILN